MMKFGKRKLIFYAAALLVTALLFGIAGCGAANKSAADTMIAPAAADEARYSMAEGKAAEMGYSPTAVSPAEPREEPGALSADTAVKRYIIRNAQLTLVIEDIEEAAKDIQSMVNQYGGYVASLEFYDLTQERRAGYISMRVPEHKYDEALQSLDELGKTKNKREYTDDVTLQYIDLEARIKNLEAQEIRLRELLERADTIEDILKIESELGRIRGNLEAMIAEFTFLKDRVIYSSVNINLEEKDPRTHTVVDGFGSFGERISDLLALNTNRFLKGFSNFLIVSIGSLPIILPLALAFFLFLKIVTAIREKKRKVRDQKDLHSTNTHIAGGPNQK
ncbi:MAG: DUF4349 domain-containing protein [Bacillota bacterium]|nr:DUF4349 domain-containing protein [Bacillota bacterium]